MYFCYSIAARPALVPVTDALPSFDDQFITRFTDLIRWRRDVRRFRSDPVPAELFENIIHLASLSPSVGYSQPWRFVSVRDINLRSAVRANFLTCNQAALGSYESERAELYAKLKLAGLEESPEQLAVFCDLETQVGLGLGRQTMPEMLEYSTVIACHTLWLAARMFGLGVGWVSILEPAEIRTILRAPSAWKLIAYLCIGFPQEEHLDPELSRHKWEKYRKPEILVR